MSIQLLPCPFCGDAEPEIERVGTSRQSSIVVCTNCGCRLESNESTEHTGELWNQRAADRWLEPCNCDVCVKHREFRNKETGAMMELFLEVAHSPVEFQDPRVRYVTVQIDSGVWADLLKWKEGKLWPPQSS